MASILNRLVLPGLASTLALSGCIESALNPTDKVIATGSALTEDKSALANETLKLHRSTNSTCVAPDHFRDIQTDAIGAFDFELTGAETQNGDIARCFDLRVPARASGAAVNAEFLLQVTQVEIPKLQLWNGKLAVTESGAGAQISFDPIDATHGITADEDVVVSNESGTAWRVAGATSPVVLSDLILEDFGGLKVQASAHHEVKGSGTTFKVHQLSDTAVIAAKAKVPASRGTDCQFGAKVFDGNCPYTDGKLTNVVDGSAADLRIDLPTATKLKTAVVRGLAYNPSAKIVFEGSVDGGVNWTKLAEFAEGKAPDFAEVTLDAAAPAVTAFRIRADGNGDPKLLSLREVSLFE